MTDEMIEITVTPERTKPSNLSLRRNSTGVATTSNSGGKEKVLPHYLRASTSSCHDFCKYGRQHAFEEKGKNPVLIGTKPIPLKGKSPLKTFILEQRNKKRVVKPNPSPEPKSMVSEEEPQLFKWDAKILKQETSTSKKLVATAKSLVALKPKSAAVKSTSSSLTPSGKKALGPAKASVSPRPSSLNSSSGKKVLGAPKTSVSPRLSSLNPSSGKKALGPPKASVSPRPSLLNPSSRKKALGPPKASVSPKPSAERVPGLNVRKSKIPITKADTLNNQNEASKADEPKLHIDDMVREKTLYVIEPKPENKNSVLTDNEIHTNSSSSLSYTPSVSSYEEEEQEDSEYTLSEDNEITLLSENNETKNKDDLETLKAEYKKIPAMVHPKDNESTRELQFRRGKVVDLQEEDNQARRLRFRKGKVLADDQHGIDGNGKKTYSRREIDLDVTKPESETVILKHQDVQGKNTQGLFNNVIEETASKLAETRKSKVLALVGAFETVISLQDNTR
ncbi:hypothetical protein GIB67_007256 [Kingdonia uniflora]|uniref:Calmodulin-binding domain-containing protein n=1 Tax=Kingdonia uniflora TaxID=39325 RepID=A0A7J7NX08_9MAGN|nr:hypothetical protein GIB67_007256 [Kingdonia uniflora]